MSEKKYLVDATEAEIAACVKCPHTQLDMSGGCAAAWSECRQWRTEWFEAHEYRERTCKIDMPVIDWDTGETDCKCSACGFSADPQEWAEKYVYCPGCGAKVTND